MPITKSRHGPTAESAAVRSASPAPVATGQVTLWTGKWPVGRRIALFLFGLFMQFAHSVFFRMLLVPGYEWLDTIEPRLYVLGEALAMTTNFGLLALPFLKAPGRVMRPVVITALALGALANAAWMIRGLFLGALWFPLRCDPRQLGFACNEAILVDIFIDEVVAYVLYGSALWLNLYFLGKLNGGSQRSIG
ncbi:MAG: hypothetical protein ACREJ5_25315 [Geminicoccaceae bacterium]